MAGVQVRDYGIGIPARDREHLFERYFRGSNATGIAGTGVGLHLVSMVVALHRGEVFVESLEGVGSRFMVRLPIPTSEEAAPRAIRRDDLIACATTQARSLLLSSVLVAVLACPAFSARADDVTAPAKTRLEEIVVTAKRRPDPVADEKLKTQVEEALHADAFFYDEHVTVTINNGIATLHGLVFDGEGMRSAVRISRRIPGVKRVVNDLEIVFDLEEWNY